jgi:hypothetical protein
MGLNYAAEYRYIFLLGVIRAKNRAYSIHKLRYTLTSAQTRMEGGGREGNQHLPSGIPLTLARVRVICKRSGNPLFLKSRKEGTGERKSQRPD